MIELISASVASFAVIAIEANMALAYFALFCHTGVGGHFLGMQDEIIHGVIQCQ